MAWLGVPQTQFEANDIDNAWLGSCLKAFQKGLGANDADDAWPCLVFEIPKALQKDLGANDADNAWLASFRQRFPNRPCCK